MRVVNLDRLTSHGNVEGRKALLEILEAGLEAADPYNNTLKLLHIKQGKLVVGNPDFEPAGSPKTGEEIYDLSGTGKIYVFGACKGVQRVAKAIEDILGDRLTGGHVIDKHGNELILERIGVTFGAHPLPDEGCIEGCRRILQMCENLKKDDLVFTISGNGISSLLTLPVPGISLDEVRQLTYTMQIERGAPTADLNCVRNHIDLLKGGRISRYFRPAKVINIFAWDPGTYMDLMYHNNWHHTLPECSTFTDAVNVLKKWKAWEQVAPSIREFLQKADPRFETVKAEEFEEMGSRIFGVMPHRLGMLPTAHRKAWELGFRPYTMSTFLMAEASQAGIVIASIATSIEEHGVPFEPPCALFTTGELLVTVGKETGVGGRNQEWALSAAQCISGSKNIVMGAVDTDGTDGPGNQFWEGNEHIPCLAGGIVDGYTVEEAKSVGVDIRAELQRHSSSPALWRLGSGILTSQNISVGDLSVTLVMGRK